MTIITAMHDLTGAGSSGTALILLAGGRVVCGRASASAHPGTIRAIYRA